MRSRSTAQLVLAPESSGNVQFGSSVTILRDDGRRQTYRIVGEDEAEPAMGMLSYVSPVARALMNKQVGDVIVAGNGEAEIVKIAQPVLPLIPVLACAGRLRWESSLSLFLAAGFPHGRGRSRPRQRAIDQPGSRPRPAV